jgi:outer membrane protein assembly factor BamB
MKKASLALYIALVICLASVSGAVATDSPPGDLESWPVFGGDLAHSGYRDLPLKQPLKINWIIPGEEANLMRIWYRKENSSPVIGGGRLFAANIRGYINAFDALSGNLVWRKQMPEPVEASLAVAGEYLYAGSVDGIIYKFRTLNGEIVWKTQTDSDLYSAPVPAGNRVYVFTAQDNLMALDADSGEIQWKYNRRISRQMNIFGHSTPALVDGILYVGFTDGNVVAVNASDGVVQWTTFINRGKYRFTDVDSSPAVSGDKVFVMAYDGNFYALDKMSGQIRYKFESGGVSTPATDSSNVYFSSMDGHVYSISKDTGKLNWQSKLKIDKPTSPVVFKNCLVVGSETDGIFILDLKDGGKITDYLPGRGVSGSPIITYDGIYFMSEGGYIYRLSYRFQKDRPKSGEKDDLSDFKYKDKIPYTPNILPFWGQDPDDK